MNGFMQAAPKDDPIVFACVPKSQVKSFMTTVASDNMVRGYFFSTVSENPALFPTFSSGCGHRARYLWMSQLAAIQQIYFPLLHF